MSITYNARIRRIEDLDETRRLLYMVMFVSRTEKYELAATVVNALLHHVDLDSTDMEPRALIRKILQALDGVEDDWIYEEIEKITRQLRDA